MHFENSLAGNNVNSDRYETVAIPFYGCCYSAVSGAIHYDRLLGIESVSIALSCLSCCSVMIEYLEERQARIIATNATMAIAGIACLVFLRMDLNIL